MATAKFSDLALLWPFANELDRTLFVYNFARAIKYAEKARTFHDSMAMFVLSTALGRIAMDDSMPNFYLAGAGAKQDEKEVKQEKKDAEYEKYKKDRGKSHLIYIGGGIDNPVVQEFLDECRNKRVVRFPGEEGNLPDEEGPRAIVIGDKEGFRTEYYGGRLLFRAKEEAQCDLNNAIISADLRQGFEDNERLLSDDAFVTVKETDVKWLITDGDKVYTLKKQEDELNIYDNREVKTDYGYILLTDNPFADGTRYKALLVAGAHSYGTLAAARFASYPVLSPELTRPIMANFHVPPHLLGTVEVVVEAQIREQDLRLPEASDMKQKPPFEIESTYRTDLESERITDRLCQEFDDNKTELSTDATVWMTVKGKEWLIFDGVSNRKFYIEWSKSPSSLKVYESNVKRILANRESIPIDLNGVGEDTPILNVDFGYPASVQIEWKTAPPPSHTEERCKIDFEPESSIQIKRKTDPRSPHTEECYKIDFEPESGFNSSEIAAPMTEPSGSRFLSDSFFTHFSRRSVVVVSPHSDDSVIACGGLIYYLRNKRLWEERLGVDCPSIPPVSVLVMTASPRGVNEDYFKIYRGCIGLTKGDRIDAGIIRRNESLAEGLLLNTTPLWLDLNITGSEQDNEYRVAFRLQRILNGKRLFSIKPGNITDELDKSAISDELRKKFEQEQELELPENAIVDRGVEVKEWLIIEGPSGDICYTVREEKDKLSIYGNCIPVFLIPNFGEQHRTHQSVRDLMVRVIREHARSDVRKTLLPQLKRAEIWLYESPWAALDSADINVVVPLSKHAMFAKCQAISMHQSQVIRTEYSDIAWTHNRYNAEVLREMIFGFAAAGHEWDYLEAFSARKWELSDYSYQPEKADSGS